MPAKFRTIHVEDRDVQVRHRVATLYRAFQTKFTDHKLALEAAEQTFHQQELNRILKQLNIKPEDHIKQTKTSGERN